MNKQITLRAVLGLTLLSGCAAIQAKPPTCSHPLGKWHDEVKSVIEIKTYDAATGAISGQYIARSGDGSWPMVGWINLTPAEPKGDHGDVFTLAVRWGDHGSVTTWTGTCAMNSKSGLAEISTL